MLVSPNGILYHPNILQTKRILQLNTIHLRSTVQFTNTILVHVQTLIIQQLAWNKIFAHLLLLLKTLRKQHLVLTSLFIGTTRITINQQKQPVLKMIDSTSISSRVEKAQLSDAQIRNLKLIPNRPFLLLLR